MSKTYSKQQEYPKAFFKRADGTNQRGRLIITPEFKRKVDLLHKKISNIEWCGFVFYKQLEGNVAQPDTLVLQAEDIFLMDIGSHSYTSPDLEVLGGQMLRHRMENPHLDDLPYGGIHTHHNMSK